MTTLFFYFAAPFCEGGELARVAERPMVDLLVADPDLATPDDERAATLAERNAHSAIRQAGQPGISIAHFSNTTFHRFRTFVSRKCISWGKAVLMYLVTFCSHRESIPEGSRLVIINA
jgi:hypothetical protein